MLFQRCSFSPSEIVINGDKFPWEGASEDWQGCGPHTDFKYTANSMEIRTVNHILVNVVKQTKVNQRNVTFEYVNVFIQNPSHLASDSTGLIGGYIQ